MKYNLEIIGGHALISINNQKYLVDTGAPGSFGKHGEVTFGGKAHVLASSYLGLDAESLSQLAEIPLDGLLGTDILGQYDLLLDYQANNLMLNPQEVDLPLSVPLEEVMGVPVVTIEVEAVGRVKCFLDTGAKLSYLEAGLVPPELEEQGKVDDFYPGFGKFSTPFFRLNYALAGRSATANFGVLPPALSGLLSLTGVRGILGYDFFMAHKVFLTLAKSRLLFG